MFDRVLKRMREKVRTRQYIMTVHAEEEKDADGLSILDVEHCILTGEIVEHQKDKVTAENRMRSKGAGGKGGNSRTGVWGRRGVGELVKLTNGHAMELIRFSS